MLEGTDRGKEGSKHSEIHSSLFVSTPTIHVFHSWEIFFSQEEDMGFFSNGNLQYLVLYL